MTEFKPLSRRSLLGGLGGAALATPAFSGVGASRVSPRSSPGAAYHIDDSKRAIAALRNLSNHLKAMPGLRLVVVALGDGVDFLLKGARDERGNPYEPMIDDLILAGVDFRICNNTLLARQIDRAQLHPEASIVESGMAELARLQLAEGFAYLKP